MIEQDFIQTPKTSSSHLALRNALLKCYLPLDTLYHLLVSVNVDVKMYPLMCCFTGQYFDIPKLTGMTSDLTWLKLLFQQSSNTEPPELLPSSLDGSFPAWKGLYSPQISPKVEQPAGGSLQNVLLTIITTIISQGMV